MSEPLTNADNFWLCMDEPSNLMVITAFMEFEELLDFNRLYATIDNRPAVFDRFKKRIIKPKSKVGMPKWEKDKNFDLRSHLHRVALPAPGDKNDLQEMVASLMTMDFDHSNKETIPGSRTDVSFLAKQRLKV